MEDLLLDFSTDDINTVADKPQSQHIEEEKFCTKWSCVKKTVQFITLDGDNVIIKNFEDEMLDDENPKNQHV